MKLLCYDTAFPRSPSRSLSIYRIAGRAFLFPVDIGPYPVLPSIVSQLLTTSPVSLNLWPYTFCFSAGNR
jgi:hypothetical protein